MRPLWGVPTVAQASFARMRILPTTLSDRLRLEREQGVDLRHRGGTFADRRRDALGRAGPYVADREHPGKTGLERQCGPAGSAGRRAQEGALSFGVGIVPCTGAVLTPVQPRSLPREPLVSGSGQTGVRLTHKGGTWRRMCDT
jgi:hypothetical protein